MAWEDVVGRFVFYSGSAASFEGVLYSEFDSNGIDQSYILMYLESLYTTSNTARMIIDKALERGNITIGKVGLATVADSVYIENMVGFNLESIDALYYVNDKGALVKEIPRLTIIHEIAHIAYPAESDAGVSAFSNNQSAKGGIVDYQNIVAAEMGFAKNIQASYLATLSQYDPRKASLDVGVSYSEGKQVDLVRLGDEGGVASDDFIDHTGRTVEVNELIFGFSGDDEILSGRGDDYIYGGVGNDTLDGGEGNDALYGGEDDDNFVTGVGNDKFYGGSGNNTFQFDTLTSGNKTFFKDGSGTNTLSASEDDSQITLDLSGAIPGIDVITGGSYSNVAVNLRGDDGYKTWDFSAVSLEKLTLKGSSAGEYIKLAPGDYTVDTGGGDFYQDTLVVQTDQNLTVTTSGTTASGFTGSQLTYTGSGYFQGGTGDDIYYLNSGLQVSGGGGSDKFVLQQTSTPGSISTSFENRYTDTNSFYIRSIDPANLVSSIELFDYYDGDPSDIIVTGVSNTDHIVTVFQSRTEASAVIWIQEKGPIWEQGVYGEFVGGATIQGLWSNFGITINTDQVSGWEIDQRILYGPDASYWSPRAGQASQANADTNRDAAAPPATALDDTFDSEFNDYSPTDAFAFQSSANQAGVVDPSSDLPWNLTGSDNVNFTNMVSFSGGANHYCTLSSEGNEIQFLSGVNNALVGNLQDDFRFL